MEELYTQAEYTGTTLYAVKVQRSLAPLSRFRGSHITTAHAHQCCRFQSYAKTVPSRMKLAKREPHSWDPRQRTTWSGLVTSDFNSVLQICLSNHFRFSASVFSLVYFCISFFKSITICNKKLTEYNDRRFTSNDTNHTKCILQYYIM